MACVETTVRTRVGVHSWLYWQAWLLYAAHLAASVTVVAVLPRPCTTVPRSHLYAYPGTRTFLEYGDHCAKHTFYWLFMGLTCVYMVAVVTLLGALVFANTASVIVFELTALLTLRATWRFLLW